jgi:diketogulonate reductase-like aldo/keto reductase
MARVPTAKLHTGASVPVIGFGTWRLKNDTAGNVYNAIKMGYRHIDCATAYDNQADVGKGFQSAFDDGLVKREDLWITSKLWNKEHGEVEEALKRVLKDLQLEYLDLYLVHWPVSMNEGPRVEPSPVDTWKALEAQVDAGRTKHIGISNHSIAKTKELLEHARIKPAVNQVEVHPYWRNQELIDNMAAQGIHVTAYSPLGSEVPEGQPSPLHDETIKKVADKLGKHPAAVMIAWGIKHGTSVIPKATGEDHIRANLEAASLELSQEDYDTIASLGHQKRSVPAKMWLKETGPYKTEADIWDKGFPGGLP